MKLQKKDEEKGEENKTATKNVTEWNGRIESGGIDGGHRIVSRQMDETDGAFAPCRERNPRK